MNSMSEYNSGMRRGGEIMKEEMIRAGYSKTRTSSSNITSAIGGFIMGLIFYWWLLA